MSEAPPTVIAKKSLFYRHREKIAPGCLHLTKISTCDFCGDLPIKRVQPVKISICTYDKGIATGLDVGTTAKDQPSSFQTLAMTIREELQPLLVIQIPTNYELRAFLTLAMTVREGHQTLKMK